MCCEVGNNRGNENGKEDGYMAAGKDANGKVVHDEPALVDVELDDGTSLVPNQYEAETIIKSCPNS